MKIYHLIPSITIGGKKFIVGFAFVRFTMLPTKSIWASALTGWEWSHYSYSWLGLGIGVAVNKNIGEIR